MSELRGVGQDRRSLTVADLNRQLQRLFAPWPGLNLGESRRPTPPTEHLLVRLPHHFASLHKMLQQYLEVMASHCLFRAPDGDERAVVSDAQLPLLRRIAGKCLQLLLWRAPDSVAREPAARHEAYWRLVAAFTPWFFSRETTAPLSPGLYQEALTRLLPLVQSFVRRRQELAQEFAQSLATSMADLGQDERAACPPVMPPLPPTSSADHLRRYFHISAQLMRVLQDGIDGWPAEAIADGWVVDLNAYGRERGFVTRGRLIVPGTRTACAVDQLDGLNRRMSAACEFELRQQGNLPPAAMRTLSRLLTRPVKLLDLPRWLKDGQNRQYPSYLARRYLERALRLSVKAAIKDRGGIQAIGRPPPIDDAEQGEELEDEAWAGSFYTEPPGELDSGAAASGPPERLAMDQGTDGGLPAADAPDFVGYRHFFGKFLRYLEGRGRNRRVTADYREWTRRIPDEPLPVAAKQLYPLYDPPVELSIERLRAAAVHEFNTARNSTGRMKTLRSPLILLLYLSGFATPQIARRLGPDRATISRDPLLKTLRTAHGTSAQQLAGRLMPQVARRLKRLPLDVVGAYVRDLTKTQLAVDGGPGFSYKRFLDLDDSPTRTGQAAMRDRWLICEALFRMCNRRLHHLHSRIIQTTLHQGRANLSLWLPDCAMMWLELSAEWAPGYGRGGFTLLVHDINQQCAEDGRDSEVIVWRR